MLLVLIWDLQCKGQMPEDEVSHENDDAIESNLGGQQVPGPLLLHVRFLQGCKTIHRFHNHGGGPY